MAPLVICPNILPNHDGKRHFLGHFRGSQYWEDCSFVLLPSRKVSLNPAFLTMILISHKARSVPRKYNLYNSSVTHNNSCVQDLMRVKQSSLTRPSQTCSQSLMTGCSSDSEHTLHLHSRDRLAARDPHPVCTCSHCKSRFLSTNVNKCLYYRN